MTDEPRRTVPHGVTRREFVVRSAAGLVAGRFAVRERTALGGELRAARPVPSPAQLAWQRDELALFLHFGVNTFTDREWGDGRENPGIFTPTALDARQWARAARAGGFRMLILTAKHHDGFCLWPTATTTHSVASSPFRGGKGDVVREMVDACRAEHLKVGLYCSPWDRNSPVYGDSPGYNNLFCDQLTELLTRYGTVDEVWFDGANGEGPNGRKQTYDWPRFWGLVRRLQPNAVIFSDAGPDIRWIGNERGVAGDTNWSTMSPDAVPYPGADGPGIIAALQNGDPDGSVWRPGETDVSIRPGWFYHTAEDAKVRTVDQLVDLYFTSVGRNSKLLLNVPPTRAGLLHETDVARIAGMAARLDTLTRLDLVRGRALRARTTSDRSATFELDLGHDSSIAVTDLREAIEHGQVVSRYVVEGSTNAARGGWRTIASGTTIGYRKLDRFPATTVRRLRVTVETVARLPRAPEVRAYG